MCVRESESWEGVTVVRTFQGSPRPSLYPSEYNNFPILIALLLEAKGLVKIVAEQTEKQRQNQGLILELSLQWERPRNAKADTLHLRP